MKNLLICILMLSLLLMLFGCADTPLPTTEPLIDSDTIPSETNDPYIPEPVYENMYSVSMPITTEMTKDTEGNLVFDYSYQSMYLIIPDKDVADKIIIDFLNRIDEAHSEAENMLNSAQNHPSGTYSYRIQYNATRIDQGVLSLYGHILQVNDAMHADYKCISANYDMITGDILTLGSILYHADQKDTLKSLVINTLESNDTLQLYDDFRKTVSTRFQADESSDEDFYFTTTGLCFYFSPYEIAPYSAGVITAEIPYNQLTGIIGDAFFPAERTFSNGDIQLIPFEDASLEKYEQFAEIIAAPDGEKILLTTDTCVQDVRIKQLVWNEGSPEYTNANTIFASNVLNYSDGILFEADFDGSYPSYAISYTKEGEYYFYYLTRNSYGQLELVTSYK